VQVLPSDAVLDALRIREMEDGATWKTGAVTPATAASHPGLVWVLTPQEGSALGCTDPGPC